MPGIIPAKIHVERVAYAADDIIGHMVPIINDGTYSSKVQTAKRKCGTRNCLESIDFDNTPTSGYSFMNISRRYSTQNTFWKIVTPWNFQAEISSENLFHLINECTIKDGLIESTVVWIKRGSELYLTHTESEIYKEAVTDESYCAKVSFRDMKPGYTCKLRETGKDVTYEYLGGMHSMQAHITINQRNGTTDTSNTLKSNRHYYFRNISNDYIMHKSTVVVTEVVEKNEITAIAGLDKVKNKAIKDINDLTAYSLKPFTNQDVTITCVPSNTLSKVSYYDDKHYNLVRIDGDNSRLYLTNGYSRYDKSIAEITEIENISIIANGTIKPSDIKILSDLSHGSGYRAYTYYREKNNFKCKTSRITENFSIRFSK